ncbi:MAG: ATP-binding cassette domain-containing protein [Pseudomonadota bacterium]
MLEQVHRDGLSLGVARSAHTSSSDESSTRGAAIEPVPTSAIDVEDLRYSVDNQTLVAIDALSIAPARTTAVIGPNGAGKSLLLRLLHGLIAPTVGTISWDGETDAHAARRKQAMVFQKPVLLRRSATANVEFALDRGLTRSARRALSDAALARVGLDGKQHQSARSLSGGEQQRLALARALVGGPATLFLDEATANLDPGSAHMIEDIVAEVARRGTTVVMVTHDLAQARRLADDVIFMLRGRIVQTAAAGTFFADPTHSDARRFLAGQLVV